MFNNNFHFMNNISVTGGDATFDSYKTDWQLMDSAKYKVARDCFIYSFDSVAKTTTKEIKRLNGIKSINPGDTPTSMQDPQWDPAYGYCNKADWNGRWVAPSSQLTPSSQLAPLSSWSSETLQPVLQQSLHVLNKREFCAVRDIVATQLVNAIVLLQKISE